MKDAFDPSTPESGERRPYVGSTAIRHSIGIALICYLCLSIAALFAIHVNVISGLAAMPLLRSHLMCGGFGTLGAAMAAIRKYYRTLITEEAVSGKTKATGKNVWSMG